MPLPTEGLGTIVQSMENLARDYGGMSDWHPRFVAHPYSYGSLTYAAVNIPNDSFQSTAVLEAIGEHCVRAVISGLNFLDGKSISVAKDCVIDLLRAAKIFRERGFEIPLPEGIQNGSDRILSTGDLISRVHRAILAQAEEELGKGWRSIAEGRRQDAQYIIELADELGYTVQ